MKAEGKMEVEELGMEEVAVEEETREMSPPEMTEGVAVEELQ